MKYLIYLIIYLKRKIILVTIFDSLIIDIFKIQNNTFDYI